MRRSRILACDVVDVRGAVALLDADQGQDARADGADFALVNRDPRRGDALQDRLHSAGSAGRGTAGRRSRREALDDERDDAADIWQP